MTDAGFEMSNQAVAAIFGSSGFLVAVLTQYIGGKKNKTPTLESCKEEHKKNADEHDKFFVRIGLLEGDQKAAREKVDGINEWLKRVEGKLDRVIETK